MGSKRRPAPRVSPVQSEQIKAPSSPYTIDPSGNINVTGNISGAQFRQAQEEARAIRQAKQEANKDTAIYGSESVADVQAREKQTLANPKKAKMRGRRSLISSPIGSSSGVLG